MGGRHRQDNRQPQPDSLRAAARFSPAESVEGVGQEVLRKAGALVLDVQLDRVVRNSCPKRDRPLPVAQRVVDQVGQGPLEPTPVRVHLHAVARRDQDLAPEASRLTGVSRLNRCEQLVHECPSAVGRRLTVPGDQQQILGQLAEAIGLLGGGANRAFQRVTVLGRGQCQLELRLQDRDRGPELVTSVGDERPLANQRLLEVIEHRVQRRAQAADLVVGRHHR